MECQRAGQKKAKVAWVEKCKTMSLLATAQKENLANKSGGRFRIKATQGGFFCGRKRKGEAGMQREETAEGVT